MCCVSECAVLFVLHAFSEIICPDGPLYVGGFFAHCGKLVLINQNPILNLSSDFSQVGKRRAELLFQCRTEPKYFTYRKTELEESGGKKITVGSVPWCGCPVLTAEWKLSTGKSLGCSGGIAEERMVEGAAVSTRARCSEQPRAGIVTALPLLGSQRGGCVDLASSFWWELIFF